MAGHVYHWRHGWIPLDHTAALSKAKGNHDAAKKMLADAKSPGAGIHSRRDVAKATVALKGIKGDKSDAVRQVRAAAARHNATDLLPSRGLPAETVSLLRGKSAEKHLVTGPNGTHFTPERQALHDKIVADIVGGHKAQSKPAFVMLGGGPASGKTRAAEAAAKDFPDAIKIDPDAIKAMLPEYSQMSHDKAAAYVHEESSYLAKRVMDAALKSKANIVLDAVGDSSADSVRGKVAKARAAGYSAHALYVTVPTEVAQARAHARGVKTGRVVPPEVIAQLHGGVSSVFPAVASSFDTATLHDNTTTWTPVLTAHHGQPQVIHNAALYQAFVGKAKKP